MTLALAKSPPLHLARAIVRRTRGRTHGPVTRLMSPSDFGEILKPFVFLDLFDHEGAPFNGPLHPRSGIATLSYVQRRKSWARYRHHAPALQNEIMNASSGRAGTRSDRRL